ncbi:amino acid adenylation domain-containing protein [Streptosporangium sp. NPDC000396]|uniref:amino acid adenylation domain-containing protein n=1 Tax=Streptosporangium sp. NPDC000396 TaxID=3366185 RepID=UPI0036BE0933
MSEGSQAESIARRREALSREARAELAARLRGARQLQADPVVPRRGGEDGEDAPLSLTQEQFWLRQYLFPEDASANVFMALRLRGHLDVAALRRACEELLRRHDVLRSSFVEVDGELLQRVSRSAPPRVPYADLTALDEAERDRELERIASEEAGRAFDLGTGLPFRASLIRMGDDHHVLLITVHHIATDAWSNTVLLEELAAIYAATRDGSRAYPPPPRLQFADYASWQRRRLGSADRAGLPDHQAGLPDHQAGLPDHQAGLPDHQAGLPDLPNHQAGLPDHRDPVLAEASPALELPADGPRSPGVAGQSGRLITTISPEVTREFTHFCGSIRVPLFAGLMAALQVLLHRYTGASGFLVGVPFGGRTRPELARVVGPLFTTVPIRADLSGAPSFRDLATRVRAAAADAFAHADRPADRPAGGAPSGRGAKRAPYDVLFALQDAPPPRVEVDGLTVEPIELGPGTAQCPLTLSITPDAGGLRVTTDYDRAVFERETAEQLARHYGRLLETLAGEPDVPVGRVPMLTSVERNTVLVEWNRTAAPVAPPSVVHEAFIRQARRTADAPALRCGTERLSYGRLERRARDQAERLVALGVGRGDVVGVCVERSAELVVALLAVLMAGAAYLPLDPSYPAERNRRALAGAGARFLIAGRDPRSRVDAAGVRVLDVRTYERTAGTTGRGLPVVSGDDIAYVMYTSGSTGTPKGVMVAHDGVCNNLEWRRRVTGVGPGDRLLHTVSFSFDPSVWQLFGPLTTGAEVVLATQEEAADPERVGSLIRDHRVTIADFVPSTLARTLDTAAPGDLASLTHVFCGGERLPRDLAVRFHERLRARLFNQYGPTEATIDTTSHPVTPAEPRHETSIGRPIANKQVYVLDGDLEPVPVRVPGELWIGGAGLAYGYVGSPAATADRFRPDPYGPPGARIYRSGDLVRHRHDGTLEFLGRLDEQVKLNGVRIEPAEVEDALREHPAVADAVVVLREVRGRPALVGYVVSRDAGAFDVASLRGHLVERVPPAFVPAHLVRVAEIPRGVTGKVAAGRLPDPPPPPAGPRSGQVFSPGSTEELLAGLWAEALGEEAVVTGSDFFQLGGDSLLAVRLVAAVRGRFGVELALHEFFEAPTFGELAGLVRARSTDRSTGRSAGERWQAFPLRRRDTDRVPLSHAQERIHRLAEAGAGPEELHVPLVARIRGDLDLDVLRRALNTVVARHEALRVSVVPSSVPGRPPEQIVRKPYEIGIERGAAAVPSPESGELLAAEVTRLGPDEHELSLTLHRVATDGASAQILAHELAVSYAALRAGRTPELPELSLQHPDYAAWERSWLTEDVVAEAVQDWLRTMPEASWPVRPLSYGPRRLRRTLTLDAEETRALAALAREQRCGLRTVLLTAWAVACSRCLGGDPVVCVPVSGRDHPAFQQVIGRFVNLAVLRVPMDDTDDLPGRIQRVQAVAVDAYRRQRSLPFAALERAGEREGTGRAPAFPMMFDLADRPAELPRIGGLDITLQPPDEHWTDFSLALQAHHQTDTLELTMLHDPEVHGAEPMAGLFDAFRAALDHAIARHRREGGR